MHLHSLFQRRRPGRVTLTFFRHEEADHSNSCLEDENDSDVATVGQTDSKRGSRSLDFLAEGTLYHNRRFEAAVHSANSS